MNPESKRKWVEALRSGRYQQGTGFLTKILDEGVKHCCLGVACLIAETSNEKEVVFGSYPRRRVTSYDGETKVLPSSVRSWLEIETPNPRVPYSDSLSEFFDGSITPNKYDEGVLLTELNDNGAPFSLIADLIEEHL